jgi:hypothetical protein
MNTRGKRVLYSALAAAFLWGCPTTPQKPSQDMVRVESLVTRTEQAADRTAAAADKAAKAAEAAAASAKKAEYIACRAEQKFQKGLMKGSAANKTDPCAHLM